MGLICLSECPSCQRHVRCGERACPFCGARVSSSLRVLEYRLLNRLDRAHAFSLGAALTAAGFVSGCEGQSVAVYGAPCYPPECVVPQGGSAGQTNTGGNAGGGAAAVGGSGGASGSMSAGGGGTASQGGNAGLSGADGGNAEGGAFEARGAGGEGGGAGQHEAGGEGGQLPQ